MSKSRRRSPRRSTARRRKEPLPGWAWMFFGLAVGLAVAAAIYVNDRSPARPEAAARAEPAAPRAPAKPAAKPDAAAAEERFQFYEILPEFEVVVPEQDPGQGPAAAPAPLTTPGVYVLQAGSFSSFEDADRIKAQIALLGISSRIQKVSIDERTFHRVRIGPVESLDEVNDMRSRLRRASIDVMVIRIGD